MISKARSALVQSVVYGGYFLMALPAGIFIKRFGYRYGVVIGLVLYGIGALLFMPAEKIMSFNYFLFSLFIIGCGLTFLETAANPYITELGDKKDAASRLNLAQSFNGLGWIIGPLVGGLIIFQKDGSQGSAALPYSIIGIIVLLTALVFSRIKLPEISNPLVQGNEELGYKSIWKNKVFSFGVIALFFYVGAQTGINSFFINYLTETNTFISSRDASLILSFGGMGLFMTGRFLGSWMLKTIKPAKLLAFVAAGASICMLLVVFNIGMISAFALFFCYFFESIMFPTIFAIAISGLGDNTKQGSSFLIMSIVGGALVPVLMGLIGAEQMSIGFIIPLFCFFIVFLYSQFLRITFKTT